MRPNPHETVDLVTFTEEILIEKFHFFVQCKEFIQNDLFMEQNISLSEA